VKRVFDTRDIVLNMRRNLCRVVLEAPEFDDALDDDQPDGADSDESGRVPGGGQDGDEAMAGESIASEEPDPCGDDLLVGSVVPDH